MKNSKKYAGEQIALKLQKEIGDDEVIIKFAVDRLYLKYKQFGLFSYISILPEIQDIYEKAQVDLLIDQFVNKTKHCFIKMIETYKNDNL